MVFFSLFTGVFGHWICCTTLLLLKSVAGAACIAMLSASLGSFLNIKDPAERFRNILKVSSLHSGTVVTSDVEGMPD